MIHLAAVFLVLLLFGHVALWVAVFNRTHSLNLPRSLIHWTEFLQIAGAVGLLLWLAYRLTAGFTSFFTARELLRDHPVLNLYGWSSVLFGCWTIADWAQRQWRGRRNVWRSSESTLHDLTTRFAELPIRDFTVQVCSRLPTNQMFSLEANVKDLVVPRLPRELDGFAIVHISDLHFTGKILRPFFDEIIEETLRLAGDVIALTGDIQEVEECHDWLEPTLGRLSRSAPAFFVLGNHDKRLQSPNRLRHTLESLGWHDLGMKSWHGNWRSCPVCLAGNERPWFASRECFDEHPQSVLRVVLSHSPDQIQWARAARIDLLLAGHTHGGHIRLPILGPIACPSWYGVRFAGGVFELPPTIMHVSRGISGLDPVRFNCPPEITKLRLRCSSTGGC